MPAKTAKKAKPVSSKSTSKAFVERMQQLQKQDQTEASQQATRPNSKLAPHLIVHANAGCGKTTTLVGGMYAATGREPLKKKQLPDGSWTNVVLTPSEQQALIWDAMQQGEQPRDITFTAFSRAIADTLVSVIPQDCFANTLHGLGLKIVKQAFPGHVANNRNFVNKYAVVNILEKLTSSKLHDMKRNKFPVTKIEDLVKFAKSSLIDWKADDADEELKTLALYYDLELNGDEATVISMTKLVLDECSKEGRREIDFNDMIWLAIIWNLPVRKVDLMLVDEAQDLDRAKQELCLRMAERLVFCGDHCQPAGTLVRTPGGCRPIESLEVGDKICSYSASDCRFVPTGYEVQGITKRSYSGRMIVCTLEDGRKTKFTPNHICLVNFTKLRNKYCVYLMRKGVNWRVGRCRMDYKAAGTGPVARLRTEKADELWILKVCDSASTAASWEEFVTVRFGISQLMFQESNVSSLVKQRQLDWIWSKARDCQDDAVACLGYFGRDIRYPLFTSSEERQQSVKRPRLVRACNVVDGCVMLPDKENLSVTAKKTDWQSVTMTNEHYEGFVFSLDVAGTKLYIADGVVTHNCQAIFGFAGADTRSMERLEEILGQTERGVQILHLTETRRCGKKIVEHVKTISPELANFTAHEDNPEGEVIQSFPSSKLMDVGAVLDGDMIMCRTNAPLVSLCFRFLKIGRKARIQGRDIGQGLVKLIEKTKADTVPELIERLAKYQEKEEAQIATMKYGGEEKLIALHDKLDCLYCFCDGEEAVEAVIRRIEAVFQDSGPGIVLSSGHKAKGLEAESALILKPELLPHPMAKTKEAIEQETHLHYVMATRGRTRLVYIKTEEKTA